MVFMQINSIIPTNNRGKLKFIQNILLIIRIIHCKFFSAVINFIFRKTIIFALLMGIKNLKRADNAPAQNGGWSDVELSCSSFFIIYNCLKPVGFQV